MINSVLRRALPACAFIAALPLASAASADAYVFTLAGPNTASFTLNSSPTPASSTADYFDLQNVAGTYNGVATTFADLTFFDTDFSGGFDYGNAGISSSQFLDLRGSQLYTGTAASPTFLLGTFNLTGVGNAPGAYTLTIAEGSVPEPATWAMMLIGFGGIGMTMRARRSRVSLSQTA